MAIFTITNKKEIIIPLLASDIQLTADNIDLPISLLEITEQEYNDNIQ